jgi:hypothetical protein
MGLGRSGTRALYHKGAVSMAHTRGGSHASGRRLAWLPPCKPPPDCEPPPPRRRGRGGVREAGAAWSRGPACGLDSWWGEVCVVGVVFGLVELS